MDLEERKCVIEKIRNSFREVEVIGQILPMDIDRILRTCHTGFRLCEDMIEEIKNDSK